MKIKELLLEKGPTAESSAGKLLADILVKNLSVKTINEKEPAKKFIETGYYPIRVAPLERDAKSLLLSDVEQFTKSSTAKKLKIKYIGTEDRIHSSRFSSVLVDFNGTKLGIVIGAGANKGENFENDLFLSMSNYAAGVEEPLGKQAFDALAKVDSSIKIAKVDSVVKRTGSTKRSKSQSPEETGKIIADIIIKMKGGKEKYISVKDANGATVANFGITEAFNDDLTVNVKSDAWVNWMAPFGLDHVKVSRGLQAYRDGTKIDWSDIETPNKAISKKIDYAFRCLWGSDYIYLRKKSGGFDAKLINNEYLNSILGGMKVTKISYPSPARKQITIICESKAVKLGIEIRNPSGQIKPKDLKMKILSSKVE